MKVGNFRGVLTPDDMFAAAQVGGKILIYDDECYFGCEALVE